MAWEGVDESCHWAVGGEVGFKVLGENVCNLGGDVVADTVELNQEVTKYDWGCP